MKYYYSVLCLFFLTTFPGIAQVTAIDDGPTDMFLIRPAIIEYTADWCPVNKKTRPVLERLSRQYSGRVDFYSVDIDYSDFFVDNGFKSIPVILFLYDYDETSGYISYFGLRNVTSYNVIESNVRKLLDMWEEKHMEDSHYVSTECVDLGLSVLWTTCNLGAGHPWEKGNFYSWGETKLKPNYGLELYKYYSESDGFYELTKYFDDEKTVLCPEDDVASITLGNGFHIPSYNQWVELLDKCTWEETSMNECEGWKVTGPNGNSIFIPYAGIREECYHYGRSKGMAYWTNEVHEKYSHRAYYFGAGINEDVGMYHGDRYFGMNVRAVKEQL